ncbi:MAG: hypothetical protein Q9170_000551 [Blastenia crenularia]
MPGKPRPKSMLSFTHRKSSSGSHPKVDNLTETAQEKASHRVTSKADPTKAINEAQPVARALEESTLESIRAIQHKDRYGNLITDPDRSNPTRPRLERPLDTIRAFEAAIDGSYERTPPSRADTVDAFNGQRQRPQQRYGGEASVGHNNNRMSIGRPDSYIDSYGGSPNQPGSGRRIGQRVTSDPVQYGTNSHGLYPAHGYHQSFDTVASASGNESHNTDPWGNSTDPSSENSSIDRVQAQKPDPTETYGFNGFGGAPQFQGPILEENGVNSPSYGQVGYGQPQGSMNGSPLHSRNGGLSAPPQHGASNQTSPRVPIKLGNLPGKGRPLPDAPAERRKSWLKRRFSKVMSTNGVPAGIQIDEDEGYRERAPSN